MPQTASEAILFVFIFYIVSSLVIITLFTLCIISLSAKIKFYKNMNRFIDENKGKVKKLLGDSEAKSN